MINRLLAMVDAVNEDEDQRAPVVLRNLTLVQSDLKPENSK